MQLPYSSCRKKKRKKKKKMNPLTTHFLLPVSLLLFKIWFQESCNEVESYKGWDLREISIDVVHKAHILIELFNASRFYFHIKKMTEASKKYPNAGSIFYEASCRNQYILVVQHIWLWGSSGVSRLGGSRETMSETAKGLFHTKE